MNKIRLLNDIQIYMSSIKKGTIFEIDEPHQGFNDDGTFTICQGIGIYHTIDKNNFEILKNE